ncbi:hypothetical protein MASR2M18_09400 [Ignavibacteria bacterium]|nr:T9SS type A sorting domain-containing protein [Bacteroidota bacterium]MCZ2133303.1 T9SS type A sorting domain-containing protein [Bacteroidota bacterium]
MKKTLSLAFAVISLLAMPFQNSNAQTVWSMQPHNINSVFFLQSNTALGWACGDFGTLLATTNGGDSWLVQKSKTTADFFGIAFADDKTGCAVGRGGIIFRTVDGGKSWEQLSSPTGNNLNSVRFAVGQSPHGYAVGQAGTVLTSSNGGASWIPLYLAVPTDLSDVSVVSASSAYIVGKGGTVLRTSDAGVTWQIVNSETTFDLGGICFVNVQTAWIAGDSGFVSKTTNGGASWTRQTSNTEVKLSGIQFSGVSVGWAVGKSGIILKTTNGGTDWATVNDTSRALGLDNDDLTCVCAGGSQSAHKAWVSGKSGLLLATRNGGFNWLRQAEKPRERLLGVYFEPNCVSGWAVGTFGNIYTTSSGGRIWQKQQSGTAVNLNAVQFGVEKRGCVVGDAGVALTTSNGGNRWDNGNTGLTDHIRVLSFSQTDGMVGWAAGVNGTVLITSDGGANWQKANNPHYTALNGIHFAESQLGCAVGALGEIITSYNGGTSWQPQTSGTTQELRDVYLTSWTTGWAVGENSTMLRTQNSGSAWANVSFLQPGRSLNTVRFTDILNGWIAGENGTILSTSDAGATWKQHKNITSENLTSISFPNARKGWFVGSNGTILHVEDNTDYLLWPNDGQSDVDVKPTFRWLKHSGSNGYKVMYSANPDAFVNGSAIDATVIMTSNESDTTAIPEIMLKAETTYFWTVEERATGFRLGVRSFRSSVAPVKIVASPDKIKVCAGKDTLLRVVASAGKPPITYKWRLSDGKPIPPGEIIIPQTDGTLRLRPQEPREITCIATDAHNHSDSATISVSIIHVLPVVLKSPEFLCEGSACRLSTAEKYAHYTWMKNLEPIGNDSVFSVTEAGKYTVLAFDSSGCEGISEEIELIPQAVPLPIIEGTDAVCVNQKNVPFRVASFSTGRSFRWSIAAGNATITSGENLSTVTITFASKGIVILRLREIFNATQCYADTTFRITVDDNGSRPVVISRSGVFALCGGAADTLDAPSGFFKYQWRRNDKDIAGQTSQSLVVSEEGAYSVYVEDIGGCKGASEPTVYKSGENPKPAVSGDAVACIGAKNVIYQIKSPQQGSLFLWSTDGAASMSGSAQGTSISVNFTNKGTAAITVRETTAAGCIGYASFSVYVADTLSPVISGTARFCAGKNTALDAGEGESYRWFFNGIEMSGEKKRTLIASKAGKYYAIVYAGNCGGTSKEIVLEELPRPDSVYFEDVRTGLLTAPAASTWQWYKGVPPDTLKLTGKTSRTLQPESDGYYSVAAFAESGCSTFVVINTGGTLQVGTFAIKGIASSDSIVSIKDEETARLEIRPFGLDSALAAAVGITKFRLHVSWNMRLLDGVFPATQPEVDVDKRSWEFVVPLSRANIFSQRLSYNRAGKTDSQATVTLFVQAEDEFGISPRGKVSAMPATVKFSSGTAQPPIGGDSLNISDVIPNPTNGKTNIIIHGKAGEMLEVYLTDNQGKRVLSLGETKISVDGYAKLQIEAQHLASGQYYVVARGGDKITSKLLQVVK